MVESTIPKELNPSKVEPRTVNCFLVGFTKQGYLLLHPAKPQAPFESNDVYFNEFRVYGDQFVERVEHSNADQIMDEMREVINLDHNYFSSMLAEFCQEETKLSDRKPQTYSDIQSSIFADVWEESITKELESHELNETWIVIPRTPEMRLLKFRWVFAVKCDDEGREYAKSRLTVKGFMQTDQFESGEIYAPVAEMILIRIMLSLANRFNLVVTQIDIETAFLYGPIEEEVFVEPPEGTFLDPNQWVCLLKKCIYGLKKSGFCWYSRFADTLFRLGFERSEHDPCFFIFRDDGSLIFLVIYVDDILLITPDEDARNCIIETLLLEYRMKVYSNPSHFLGFEINRDLVDRCMYINQTRYVEKLLNSFNMLDCNPLPIPMQPKVELTRDCMPDQNVVTKYRSLVGSLLYLSNISRPDVTFASNIFSRYQSVATENHFAYAKHVLRYLNGTRELSLKFDGRSDVILEAYVDASLASDCDDRKSTSGYILYLYGDPIYWRTKKQSLVVKGSADAEIIAVSDALDDIYYAAKIVGDVFGSPPPTVIVHEDNSTTIKIAQTPLHKRSRAADTRIKYVQQAESNKEIHVVKIPGSEQIADIFTKALPKPKFEYFRDIIFKL